MRRWPALLALLVVGACTTGLSAEKYSRRYGPFGAATEVRAATGRVVIGELLDLDDSTLVILEKQRVVVVPFAVVRYVSIEKLTVEPGGALYSARFRREARLRGRYPKGITPELMARLLARGGQEAPDTVRAGTR